MKRFILAVSFVGVASTAHAQWVVIDPGNLAKAILIVERTYKQYEILVQQYQRLTEMSAGLPGMDAYRLNPVRMGQHDVGRYLYGGPLLSGLNHGDPRGELYSQVISAIPVMAAGASRLPAGPRLALEHQIASVEISDSILQRGIHQVGALRGFSSELDRAIQLLQDHVTNPRTSYHYFTAVADKLSGAEVIGRQQDEATNQYLSHSLEQQILKSKRDRDTEAEIMNMRINSMRYGRDAQAALFAGADADLATWRQP